MKSVFFRSLARIAAGLMCRASFAEAMRVLHPHLLYHAEEMQVTVLAPGDANRRIQFEFHFEEKTLTRGTLGVDADGTATLRFSAPEPRPGIPVPLTLNLTGSTDTLTTKLWIFSERAVFVGKEQLNDWPLWLYDPLGETSDWLQQHKIPFRRVREIAEVNGGVLLVGERAPIRGRAGFLDQVLNHSAAGVPVLILSPDEGLLDLPSRNQGKNPPDIQFSGWGRLFDPIPYLAESDPDFEAIDLIADRGNVKLALNAATGWPLVCITEEGGAPLMLCGISLRGKTGRSPEPLLQLRALLFFAYDSIPERPHVP